MRVALQKRHAVSEQIPSHGHRRVCRAIWVKSVNERKMSSYRRRHRRAHVECNDATDRKANTGGGGRRGGQAAPPRPIEWPKKIFKKKHGDQKLWHGYTGPLFLWDLCGYHPVGGLRFSERPGIVLRTLRTGTVEVAGGLYGRV